MTYQKTFEEDSDNIRYVFTFESLNLKTGKGNLYFKFYYQTANVDESLNSVFVIGVPSNKVTATSS